MGRKAIEKKRLLRPDKQRIILLGLMEFFKTNRLKDSNMDEMAAFLNRSKATIYKHFKGKEAIIDAIIQMRITAISGFVQILNDEDIEFFDRYKESYELLSEHIADITNEFLADVKEMYPSIYSKIEQLIDLAVYQLKLYYEEGMEIGVFAKLNSDLLAQNDFLFFRSLTDPAYLDSINLTMDEAFAEFYKIRIHGLLNKVS